MAYNRKRPFTSGRARTGEATPPPAEEVEQEIKEAQAPKAPLGQAQADAFFKAHQATGMEDSPVPEHIFLGASVDPEDMGGGSRKFIGRKGMRERFGPEMQIGMIDDRLAKMLGIDLSTEEPTYMLMDGYAGNGRNFQDEWLANNPDGRIPVYKSGPHQGQPYNMQGYILGVIPRVVMQEIRDELNEEVTAKQYQLEHGNPDLPSDERKLQEMRAETSESIKQMLQGSSTGKQDLEVALSMRSKEQVEADVDKYRWLYSPKPESRGTDTVTAQKNVVDRALETAKAESKGSKSFAVSGFRDRDKT